MNNVYQIPKGYESFEKIKSVIEANLPDGCKIELDEAGGTKGFVGKIMEKAYHVSTHGFGSKVKTLGEIDIKKNAYVGISIVCSSSDGEKADMITVVDYVPSAIIRFLMSKVLGYITNLIFPAIYGSPAKLSETIDKVIMKNFEADKLDTSVLGAIKGIGKGLGVKESSVKE
jgi:hypothetical protein